MSGAIRAAGLGLALGLAAGCSDSTAPPLAAEVEVASGGGQSGEVAQPLPQPVVFQVRDAEGRPISGAGVTFEVTQGGGSVVPGTATTGPEGMAHASWTLGTDLSVPQRLTATAGSIDAVAQASPRAGPPSLIHLFEGDEQSGPTGVALGDSLGVRVFDAYGNPVADAVVTWIVQEGGGAISPVQVNAGTDGRARAHWTLGTQVGSQSAQAASGTAPAVHFEATGIAHAGISGTVSFADGFLVPPMPAAFGSFTAGGTVFEGSRGEPFGTGTSGAATLLAGGSTAQRSTAPAGLSPSTLPMASDSVPREWVVQLRASEFPTPPVGGPGLSGTAATAMAQEIRSALGTHPELAAARASITGISPVLQAVRLRVSADEDEAAVVSALRADPRVERVEPLRMAYSHGTPVAPASGLPEGAFYPRQSWHYGMMSLPRAWGITQGSSTVIVAVIDDGIRFDHVGFAGNLTSDGYDFVRELADPLPRCGGGFISNPGDGDGPDPNPEIPASYSYNSALSCWSGPNEFGGHGLHVAGTIAASASGIVGVAPNVRIRPVRVLGTTGSGTTWDVAQGVLYAAGLPADNGAGVVQAPSAARIINMSLGASVNDPFLAAAVQQATAAGSLIIASAGNTGNTALNYPAAYPETISVSAVGPDFQLAPYSTFGSTIDLAAPGGNLNNFGSFGGGIWSAAWNFHTQQSFITAQHGTSMAAPHVSGAAALLLSQHPGMSAAELKARLFQTARDIGAPGKDSHYGHGFVDALLALTNGQGLPATLRASLFDANTGLRVAQLSAGEGSTFHFPGLTEGEYLVYAGFDDQGSGVTGQPGFLWGARGGAAQPMSVQVAGEGIQDGSLTIGFPMEEENDGSPASANSLPLGGYLYGAIATLADQDHFRVLIPESGSYTFETGGVLGMCGFGLEVNTILDLLDAGGQVLFTNNDIDAGGERFCSRIETQLSPGTYLLRVRGTFGSAGTYSIRAH